MNGALSFHELTVGYGGEPVLHEVTFALEPGEIVALLGANGAGKTTLLRTLAGFVRPRAGTIRLDGDDLARLSPEDRARRGIAQVPEGRSVVAELTVDENLRLGALWRHRGRARETAIAEVYELFEPLARRRSSDGHQLSGGERQMLALSKAIVQDPRVLVVDEFSLGLAPVVVGGLLELVRRLNERGTAVLLVEQSVNVALSLVDRAYFMEKGQIVACETAAELSADPDRVRELMLGGHVAVAQ